MAGLFDEVVNNSSQSNFYKLLGCDELSTKEQINSEFKQRAKKLHPDKRPEDERASQLFERLCKARDTLCDKEKRKEYDYWLRTGITVPFDTWLSLNLSLHSSIHWAPRPRKKPMLDCMPDKKRASEEEEEKEAHMSHLTKNSSRPYAKLGWTSKKNGHISKFRRYEI